MSHGSLVVRGGWVLSGAPADGKLVRDGAVLVADGRIAAVGPADSLAAAGIPSVGDERHLVLPGLVNAHHHARGVTWLQRGHPDERLETWLLGFRFAPPIDVERDARYAAERLLQSGVTTVLVSHYAAADSSLEETVSAVTRGLRSTGLRVAFALGVMDRSAWSDPAFRATLPPALEQRLAELVGPAGTSDWPARAFDLFDALRTEAADSGVSILLGPVSPLWCSDEVLLEVARRSAATGAGVHTHALETRSQQRRLGGLTRLAEIGFLSERVSLAHCAWLDDADIEALAITRATVVHNPSSNLRLGSGIAPLGRLRDAGVSLALGTDSMGLRDDDDLLADMGLAAALHRPAGVWLEPSSVVAMATTGSARAAGLEGRVGRIEPGMCADLTLVDMSGLAPPEVRDAAAPLDLLVGRATARDVDIVIVDGEILVDGGRLRRTDADATAQRVPDSNPWEQPGRELVAQVRPYVERFFQA